VPPTDPRLKRAAVESIQSSIRHYLDEAARIQPDVVDPNARRALVSLKVAVDQMFTLLQLALANYLREASERSDQDCGERKR